MIAKCPISRREATQHWETALYLWVIENELRRSNTVIEQKTERQRKADAVVRTRAVAEAIHMVLLFFENKFPNLTMHDCCAEVVNSNKATNRHAYSRLHLRRRQVTVLTVTERIFPGRFKFRKLEFNLLTLKKFWQKCGNNLFEKAIAKRASLACSLDYLIRRKPGLGRVRMSLKCWRRKSITSGSDTFCCSFLNSARLIFTREETNVCQAISSSRSGPIAMSSTKVLPTGVRRRSNINALITSRVSSSFKH